MAEWTKAPDLKSGVGNTTGGSNPSPSAMVDEVSGEYDVSYVVTMRMVGLNHAVAAPVRSGLGCRELADQLEALVKSRMEDTFIDCGYEVCLHAEVVLRVVLGDEVTERRFEAGVKPTERNSYCVQLPFASIIDAPSEFVEYSDAVKLNLAKDFAMDALDEALTSSLREVES